MSLKNVDIGSALRLLAERRIEEAMKEGKFDNNPLAGKDIEFEEMPAEEEARLRWWALRILNRNDVIPDEVRYRKGIDHLRDQLDRATDAGTVRKLVARINDLVRRINTLGTTANPLAVAPVQLEIELEKFHARQQRQGG